MWVSWNVGEKLITLFWHNSLNCFSCILGNWILILVFYRNKTGIREGNFYSAVDFILSLIFFSLHQMLVGLSSMFGVVNAVESQIHRFKARGCKYWTVPPLNQSLGAGRSFPWLSGVPVQFSLVVQLPKVPLLWGRCCSKAGYWWISGLSLVAELAKMFPPDLPPSSADVEKEFMDDASWVGQEVGVWHWMSCVLMRTVVLQMSWCLGL